MKLSAMGIIGGLLLSAGLAAAQMSFDEQARERRGDLALGSYATAHTVQRLANDAALRDQALEKARGLGLTAMFLEVYRSGTVVPLADLRTVRDFFNAANIDVIGGIATVPGGDFGFCKRDPWVGLIGKTRKHSGI
jgi:hypothetical protein